MVQAIKNNKGLIFSVLAPMIFIVVGVIIAYWKTSGVKHAEYEQKFIQHDQRFIHMERQDMQQMKQLDKIEKKTERIYQILLNK